MAYVNANPGQFNLKVHQESRQSYTSEQMRQRDLAQRLAGDDDYRRHHQEYNARVRWCIDQGPEYWPAHHHKHRALGNDNNFIFKIPPWHANGTPNPLGIPDNRVVEPVPDGFELIPDFDSKAGWHCHKCQEWIPFAPRPYDGKDEPEDWWWCQACRRNKPKMTAREKHLESVLQKVHDIRSLMQ